MKLQYGRPLTGREQLALISFLKANELSYEENIDFTVVLWEDDAIVATGSLSGNTIKCIAVSKQHQSEGLAATVITELYKQAAVAGISHLLLYTKPANKALFRELGFFEISHTSDVLLMENQKDGIRRFVEALKQPGKGESGCIVANCNPFTNGHLYLIETAAKQCDHLYVFILSEERSDFPAETRRQLAVEATAHLSNVDVHPTGSYMVSAATFPAYFLKGKTHVREIHCRLDLQIFVDYFAPALSIVKRFVGSEPYCQVTAAYNRDMHRFLPDRGIEVIELPRLEADGLAVSASQIRELILRGDFITIQSLVPDCTYQYIKRRWNHAGH